MMKIPRVDPELGSLRPKLVRPLDLRWLTLTLPDGPSSYSSTILSHTLDNGAGTFVSHSIQLLFLSSTGRTDLARVEIDRALEAQVPVPDLCYDLGSTVTTGPVVLLVFQDGSLNVNGL